MPWGNRALLFRDPDGNLVNLFTPVTPEAIAKFGQSASGAREAGPAPLGQVLAQRAQAKP
jgi:hypothetical protein